MINVYRFVVAVLLMSMNVAQGQVPYDFKDLGRGWRAVTKQVDPFDKTKIQIIQITKDEFTFRCEEINMKVYSGRADGFSYPAEIKYIVDDQDAVEKAGKYSTYLGGVGIVTSTKYYSSKLLTKEVETLKNGQNLKLAAKNSVSGWTTKELVLDGFASAYDEMCK